MRVVVDGGRAKIKGRSVRGSHELQIREGGWD